MAQLNQSELDQLLGGSMFELVPFNVAVIDRDFNIVAANENFEDFFGDWRNRTCYDVYKRVSQRCERCPLVSNIRGRARARVG